MSPRDRWLHFQLFGKWPERTRSRRRPRRGPARNWRYRAWVRTLPSAVSCALGCEAAHTGTDGGMRQKSSDYTCIPLTPEEHAEYHRIGRKDFEVRHGIDCEGIVRRLNALWFRWSEDVK